MWSFDGYHVIFSSCHVMFSSYHVILWQLSSETSSDYGGSVDVTFDNDVTPTLFSIVQEEATDRQDSYQVEQSLLGSTEVQEWKMELTNEEEAISATPSQCKYNMPPAILLMAL